MAQPPVIIWFLRFSIDKVFFKQFGVKMKHRLWTMQRKVVPGFAESIKSPSKIF